MVKYTIVLIALASKLALMTLNADQPYNPGALTQDACLVIIATLSFRFLDFLNSYCRTSN